MDARDIIKCNLRRRLSTFPEYNALSEELQDRIVRKVERSCYNQTIDQCMVEGISCTWPDIRFLQVYSSNTSRILANLKFVDTTVDPTVGATVDTTPSLCSRIISGEIDPDNIATVPNHILDPVASAKERAEIDLRLKQKIDQKVSRKYTCKRCGGNETIVIEYQARCADEGSSHSIKCVKCENVQRK
jgi:DNA-directed RNA polymerase subunit M/transcription elongation factor TFIIS